MVSSFEIPKDAEFETLRTNGIKVNYWVVCKRKVWLYAKGLKRKPLSDGVTLGKLLPERAYSDLPRRELLIDDFITVDLIEHENKVLEVKHLQKLIEAARLQVACYLLYLRWLGAGELVGKLRFSKERCREEVRLRPELEAQVVEALRDIQRIEQLPSPPELPLCLFVAFAPTANSVGGER